MARRRDQFGPFPVPPDSFFGMGDNRDNSLDSRYWGAIPRANIFGRPSLLYWSYEAEPNSHIWRGPVAKVRQLAEVAIHFFSRTRWDRMFTVVR
jgi:signal peptidase I